MDKIDYISLLNENDKNILKSFSGNVNILKTMSIFSNKGSYCNLNDYSYFKTDNDINIYYIGSIYVNDNKNVSISIFIDENKKILFDSKYYFYMFDRLINSLNMILNVVNNIDLNNYIDIGSDIISIEKWFITYGHFQDEAYNLCDFKNDMEKITNINYKVILDYGSNNNLISYNFSNYKIIDNYLFGNSSINAFDNGLVILKMRNLNLITHNITDKTFHNFPMYSRNLILSKIEINDCEYDKVFITRGIATHLSRNLSNEKEIEDILISKKYFIVNPELDSFNNFINKIRNAKIVVLTWGGALTNMVYLNQNTVVYILKSQSYEHESIELFMKIIKKYKLQIHIIVHKNNKIEIKELSKLP